MAASTQKALEDIERRRVQLQQTVDQLRKSLSHWTTWEAEYEALKIGLKLIKELKVIIPKVTQEGG